MNGAERREKILTILSEQGKPVSGARLSEILGVSRQVIVQDIALIRVNDKNIISTSQGYMLNKPHGVKRTFKVRHSDSQMEDELNCIVDAGGTVLDVFVDHSIYGEIKSNLYITNRLDVKRFMENFKNGKSSALKNLTFDYHYHTVEAASEELLDIIKNELKERNYLV